MPFTFRVQLDVRESLYTAVGDADLRGLGEEGTSDYDVREAHVDQVDANTWEVELEVDHLTGSPVDPSEIAQAIEEFFDGELVVDIESFERR